MESQESVNSGKELARKKLKPLGLRFTKHLVSLVCMEPPQTATRAQRNSYRPHPGWMPCSQEAGQGARSPTEGPGRPTQLQPPASSDPGQQQPQLSKHRSSQRFAFPASAWLWPRRWE